MTNYLIPTWLPELIDNIRLVCTHTHYHTHYTKPSLHQPHLSSMFYTSTLLLHRCPLLLLLGLSSAYVVVLSGRWLSRREDQLILSSPSVLLFPISCSPQVATSFILLPSVSFRRRLGDTIRNWFVCQVGSNSSGGKAESPQDLESFPETAKHRGEVDVLTSE